MKILFDTNVFLDVFLKRTPFFEYSSQVMASAEKGVIEGWICGTSVTTIHYLLARGLTEERARGYLKSLFKIYHVAGVNRAVLTDALESEFNDYEDAVLYQSARHANLDGIVTRDPDGFIKADIPVYGPEDLLTAIEALDEGD